MMQSSNIAVVATLFIFAAVFAQAAYSLQFEAPQRSKRLFWVDKKADTNSEPEKRLFWVDKKTPEKRLFWVDKKTPEKRLFWVDKKGGDAVVHGAQIDAIAKCMEEVLGQYLEHISSCRTAGNENFKECKLDIDTKKTQANANCLGGHEDGSD